MGGRLLGRGSPLLSWSKIGIMLVRRRRLMLMGKMTMVMRMMMIVGTGDELQAERDLCKCRRVNRRETRTADDLPRQASST